MTDLSNANGSVTYSADVPGPIQVEADGNLFTVIGGYGRRRGEQYIVEDAEQAEQMRAAAAELIAVADAFDRHQEQQSIAAVDRLAEALYIAESADSDGPPPSWADAQPATRRRLENKADALRSLGVTVGA